MSNLDLKQDHTILWWIASFSGKGVTSFQVLSFCCHRSDMVCNVLFFFGIHSIGVACLSAAGIHHPAVVYHSIFWASSRWNASGNLGNLCLSCFDSLIKGISWRTSQSGGSSNGSGPNRSLNNFTKSRNIFECIFTHRFFQYQWFLGWASSCFCILYFQHVFSIYTTFVGRWPWR